LRAPPNAWLGAPPEGGDVSSAETQVAGEYVEQTVFREVIGRFASGVTIITTRLDGQDFGTTASAVSSLSTEPPMLLVCLNRTSETQRAVAEAGRFAVNILAGGQAELAYAFARKSPDKFRDFEIVRGDHGVPLIPGTLATLECRVQETATGGTHTVIMGTVISARAREGEPLAYFRGKFGRFEDTLQDAAYRRIRALVVSRELPKGQPLDVERLATDLDLDRAHVFYALTKLTTDGLVARMADGSLVVKALDVRTAHDAIEARCAIEVAVVDKVAGALSPEDAATLREHARAAQSAVDAEPPDLKGLFVAGREFHTHFIGLLDNEALLGLYRRLDFGAIWGRAAPVVDERGQISAAYLAELAEACIAGDGERAKTVLYEHAAQVKEYARAAIERLGGDI
jgi:flavin reductase (DIM6/NTAB) family NADH-FMN oxidoreductase RutF/DNA-binding GntR family transcriptional regulator